jgi:hypothetical protein
LATIFSVRSLTVDVLDICPPPGSFRELRGKSLGEREPPLAGPVL